MAFESAQDAPQLSAIAAAPPPIRRLGLVSGVLAGAGVVLEILAIAVGNSGLWTVATVLAWLVSALLAVSFVLGAIAALTRRGRRWGSAAVVVSVVSHPLLLVWLFRLIAESR